MKTLQENQKSRLFDKKANIKTSDAEYHIRNSHIYICGSDFYGDVYTISSNKYDRKNVHIIKEIYPTSNDRFRFLMLNLHNAKKFKTIEKDIDGTERRINVIESFTGADEYICSIGDIKSFDSDIDKKEKTNKGIKILQLILPKGKDKKGNKKAA